MLTNDEKTELIAFAATTGGTSEVTRDDLEALNIETSSQKVSEANYFLSQNQKLIHNLVDGITEYTYDTLATLYPHGI